MDWMLESGPADVGGDRRVDLHESIHRMLDSRRIDVGATQSRISRYDTTYMGPRGSILHRPGACGVGYPFLLIFSSKIFALILMWHTTRESGDDVHRLVSSIALHRDIPLVPKQVESKWTVKQTGLGGKTSLSGHPARNQKSTSRAAVGLPKKKKKTPKIDLRRGYLLRGR